MLSQSLMNQVVNQTKEYWDKETTKQYFNAFNTTKFAS